MRNRKTLKKEVSAHKGPHTVEGSQTYREHTKAYKAFTTKPKLRRLVFRKQQTVRNRVYALQESFYPTKDIPYNAAKMRMATLLGICDRMSVLAYLGRPECASQSVMDQTVRYLKSGATVPKRHYFKRKLLARKGYIEVFGVGYVYVKNGEWFIHWNHTEQLTFSDISENLQNQFRKSSPAPPQKSQRDERYRHNITVVNCSKEDFSLSYNSSKHSTLKDHNDTVVMKSELDIERRRRERYSIRERNCESESKHDFHGKDHNVRVKVKKIAGDLIELSPLEKAILRVSKEAVDPG